MPTTDAEVARCHAEQARARDWLADNRTARPTDLPPARRTDTEMADLGTQDWVKEGILVSEESDYEARDVACRNLKHAENVSQGDLFAAEATQ